MATSLQARPPRPPVIGGERAPRLKFPMRVRRIRLMFSEGKWSTVANFVINRKTLPQGHAVPKEGGRGFWYELRDSRGRILYSRKVANPFQPSLELFDPGDRITRVDLIRKTVYVELLLPDLPAATEFRILSDITPDGGLLQRAEPIRVETMSEYREGGRGSGGDDDGNK